MENKTDERGNKTKKKQTNNNSNTNATGNSSRQMEYCVALDVEYGVCNRSRMDAVMWAFVRARVWVCTIFTANQTKPNHFVYIFIYCVCVCLEHNGVQTSRIAIWMPLHEVVLVWHRCSNDEHYWVVLDTKKIKQKKRPFQRFIVLILSAHIFPSISRREKIH